MSCETMAIEQSGCEDGCISKDRYYTKEEFDALLLTKEDAPITSEQIFQALGMREVIYETEDCDGTPHKYKVLVR